MGGSFVSFGFSVFSNVLDTDIAAEVGTVRPAIANAEPFIAVLAPGTDGAVLSRHNLIPIPNQGALFVGSSSAPQRTPHSISLPEGESTLLPSPSGRGWPKAG